MPTSELQKCGTFFGARIVINHAIMQSHKWQACGNIAWVILFRNKWHILSGFVSTLEVNSCWAALSVFLYLYMSHISVFSLELFFPTASLSCSLSPPFWSMTFSINAFYIVMHFLMPCIRSWNNSKHNNSKDNWSV